MTSKLRTSRRRKGLTLRAVAEPLGRTVMWLSLIERGKLPASEDTVARIIEMIDRLSKLRCVVAESRDELATGLRLPKAKNRTRAVAVRV